tara:strand:+ start:587 stop:718 length:132 start_codon:yes stop_codon:yes gene_type:complete
VKVRKINLMWKFAAHFSHEESNTVFANVGIIIPYAIMILSGGY